MHPYAHINEVVEPPIHLASPSLLNLSHLGKLVELQEPADLNTPFPTQVLRYRIQQV